MYILKAFFVNGTSDYYAWTPQMMYTWAHNNIASAVRYQTREAAEWRGNALLAKGKPKVLKFEVIPVGELESDVLSFEI